MPVSLESVIDQEDGWPTAYYNAVRFYFWEPELLSKITLTGLKNAAARFETADEVYRHFHSKLDGSPGLEQRTFQKICRTEEPFNHQLELFLKLSSKEFLDALLTEAGQTCFSQRPHILTRTVEQVWPGGQPDILFLTPEDAVAIEVKPPHGKSFAGQLAKYALLFDCIRQARPTVKRSGLIYLANGGPAENFPSGQSTVDDYRRSEIKWAESRQRRAFKGLCADSMASLTALIGSLRIDFVSFDSFVQVAQHTMNTTETERLLVSGLASEMLRRGYLES